MEFDNKKFDTICRLCLSHEAEHKIVSLIDESGENGLSMYGLAFQEITKIPVKQNEYLPANLCEKCRVTLEGVTKFIVACRGSDKKLRKLIKFSLKQDLEGNMVKEVVLQYTLFRHNFCVSPKTSEDQGCSSHLRNLPENDEKKLKIKVEAGLPQFQAKKYGNMHEYSSDNNQNDSGCASKTENDVDIFITSIKKLVASPTSLDCNPRDKNTELDDQNSTNKFQHNLEAKPTKRQNITCNICQKVLATEKIYRLHVKRHGNCKFVCDQCGKSFPISTELVQHQIHNHGARSKFECDICSYRAVQKIQLIEHMRLHTGERPFTCEKCGQTFRRKTLYNRHARFHGEKTVACDLCPKKFFLRSAMLAHRNMHNREYVFPCKICKVTYALSRTVRKHMTDVHGVPKHMQGRVERIYKDNMDSHMPERKDEDLNHT